MKSYFLALVFCLGIVFCEECTNVCYNDIRNALADLIELYKKCPSGSNNPPKYININALITRTINIISTIKDWYDVTNKTQNIQYSITHAAKKIKLYRHVVGQINLINQTMVELKRKKLLHKDAVIECLGAIKLHKELRKYVNEIDETGQSLVASFDATLKLINKTKEYSSDVKNDLDDIVVSDALFQKYLCNSRLRTTIQDIIDSMREIVTLLKQLFNDFISTNLKKLEEDAAEIQDIIDVIEKNLEEGAPKTDITVTDETRPTIEKLQKQLQDLKDRIDKQINVDNMSEAILERARKRLRNIINEEEAIMDHLFSEQNVKRVTHEIDTAKQTLDLLKDRKYLKVELDSVKKIVDTLKERGACFINDTVKVEQ